MNKLLSGLALSLLAGCFTASETEFPVVATSRLPAEKDIKVQLSGFEATVTSYTPVFGYETVMVNGYGHHGYWYTYPATVSTTSYIPQVSSDKAYIQRATDTLERSGYILQTTAPEYRIDVKFTGPFTEDGDLAKCFVWNFCTLLFCDKMARNWNARLKIYDLKTGKVIFDREYKQRYEAVFWGVIPFFSAHCSEKNDMNYVQGWMLAALTDRAIADAAAFLGTRTP